MLNVWFKISIVLGFIITLFNVEGVASLEAKRKFAASRPRLSRRSFTAPDAEKVVSTAKTGLMGILAAVQHTVDNEYNLVQAKPAAAANPNTGTTAKVSPGFR